MIYACHAQRLHVQNFIGVQSLISEFDFNIKYFNVLTISTPFNQSMHLNYTIIDIMVSHNLEYILIINNIIT